MINNLLPLKVVEQSKNSTKSSNKTANNFQNWFIFDELNKETQFEQTNNLANLNSIFDSNLISLMK